MTVNHLIKITRFHPGQIYHGFIFFQFSSHLCFTFVFNLIWGQVVSKAGTPITMICRVSVRSEQVFQYKHSTSVNITHINIPSLNKCIHQNLIRHAVLIQLIRANAPSVQHKVALKVQQSVFVFIPESDGTDTAREIRYKTHRTYLAKAAFFIFPQACEYAGVILVNAILVLLKQKQKKVCCWDRYGLRVLTCSFLSPWLRMLFMSLCSRCKPPYRDHTLGLLVDKRPSTVVFRLDSSFQCSFLEGNREARRHLKKREEVQRFWCWQCSWLIH